MYRVVRSGASLCAFILLSSIHSSYADNATSTTEAAASPAAANSIVVLQTSDPEPASAVKLQTIRIGDDIPLESASYAKLIASAREIAKKENANIIKITEQKARNRANICDHITATLYKADNPRSYETGFSWTPERRLNWNDFKGPVQGYSSDNVAAATFCSIGFETNTLSSTNNKLKVNVFNTFYTTRSWGREGEKDDRLLAHEQGHFDLCELYTRKLRERMSGVNVNVNTLSSTLKGIYNQLQKEYQDRQELYEEQTDHGLITAEQMRWQNAIAQELKETDNWKES